MYLLSQIWLYLLLACLAGLALGLLLNRVCQQRRHAAQLDALEAQHREVRTRSDAALVDLRGEHALALEAAGADRTALQIRLEALEAEHRLTGERALALSTSVNEHQAARQGLGSEVESLQGRLGALQATYESRITLLNTETSRSVQLTDELTALQSRHAALEEAHRSALAERAEVAKEAYVALIDTQAERDAARATAAETEAELTRERQAAALAAQQQTDTIATLETELAALRNQRTALQGDLSHHQSLLSVETGRGAELLVGLTALQGTHSAALSAHDGALARAQAELAAAHQTAAATEAELQTRLVAEREASVDAAAQTAAQVAAAEADRAAQAEQAVQQQADAIAALSAHDGALVKAQAELDAARQTASATEAECAACAAQAERAAQQHADATAAFETELATLRAAAAMRDAEAELSRERQAALLAAGVAAAAALSRQQSHQHALATLEQQHTDLTAQRDRRIAELQALLADQEAAWQAAERQAQELRDAQAAGQSAAQLREQAIQQELALTQTRIQELETELRTLRLTLTENDEQLATLSARLQAERDQQQAAQLRIAELAALVPPPAPEVPVVVRPAVSAAATITSAELERLVLAAGAGQQPAPVEIDHQRPDDLKIIDGIGPVNERWLHAHGVHYFWQIASWSPAELAWVAHHLPNFGSRVYRENWIAQAAKLAAQQSIR
ncbi:MAG: putative rane protein [Pseudomonadota bacterium]